MTILLPILLKLFTYELYFNIAPKSRQSYVSSDADDHMNVDNVIWSFEPDRFK